MRACGVERVENLFGNRQEVEAMYTHILIPTDGSELSNNAIRYGVALAKAVNAKVTGITVTTPFHVIAMDPETQRCRPERDHPRPNKVTAK
jgi:nucleotide-binding universal stress UspA family protein